MPATNLAFETEKEAFALTERPSLAYILSSYPLLSMVFVLREVIQLRQMGFHIDVASINSPDRKPDQLTSDEISESQRTYYLKEHSARGALSAHFKAVAGSFTGYLRGLRMVFRLAGWDIRKLGFQFFYFTEGLMVGEWMRQKQQRHLHAHLASQAATVGLYVREVFGFGFSMTVHGPDEFYDARGQNLPEKIAAADFICCISYFARSQLMKLSPYVHWDKMVVTRLGVDPDVFMPRPERFRPEVFEILCVGRLTPAKGQHILLDATAALLRQGRQVRLRLVGAGPDEASLRECVSQLGLLNRVVFEGAVNQDYIRRLYASADIFCIPSFAEGIPVVLMEAMAMEIPCVTTHITGIPELIRDGVDGLLVAASDLGGLVNALATLMDNPQLREQIGKNARLRVLEEYNLRPNVERLARIFMEQVKTDPVPAKALRA